MAGRPSTNVEDAGDEIDSAVRTRWTLGDYHRFALATVWEVGPVLVKACGIGPGDRVLDVAAHGERGDPGRRGGCRGRRLGYHPENFEAGQREAAAHGVEVEWVEADAEALPFGDASFDVVTSSFGAMFGPDHGAVADELLRVCRSGGTIGVASFTPEGLGGSFFAVLGPHMPAPPPEAQPPLLWGSEDHVRALFGDRVESLDLTRRTYVERSASPGTYRELFETTFGPVVALRAAMSDDPRRAAALDRDFAEFVATSNRGPSDGPAEYPYEYLLAVARERRH